MTDTPPVTPPSTPPVDTLPPSSVLGSDIEPGNTPPPGDTPPPSTPPVITSDSYEVADIENFDFAEFKGIEENQAFLNRAAEAGISNDQMKFILGEYSQIIPSVMEQMSIMQSDTCTAALTVEWGAETQANLGFAQKAAQAAGLSADDINNPTFGNNPSVIKLLAHFGKQLGEDTPLNNTQQSQGEDIQQLMASEAYSNASHPDHKRITNQVNSYYAKQYPDN